MFPSKFFFIYLSLSKNYLKASFFREISTSGDEMKNKNLEIIEQRRFT